MGRIAEGRVVPGTGSGVAGGGSGVQRLCGDMADHGHGALEAVHVCRESEHRADASRAEVRGAAAHGD